MEGEDAVHIQRVVQRVEGDVVTTTLRAHTREGDVTKVCRSSQTAIGRGSFGSVSLAVDEANKQLAIKTITHQPQYLSLELYFLQQLDHPNVVALHFHYFTDEFIGQQAESGSCFLHLAMEYMPEDLYTFINRHRRRNRYVSTLNVQLIMYQVVRALSYLHDLSLCHRDIKPHNVLIDEQSGIVKLCDLGSMKVLGDGSTSTSYICSRFYRAPELLCGSSAYTNAVDVWSVGCLFAEVVRGDVLFRGANTAEQMARILDTLGSPTAMQRRAFCTETQLPSPLPMLSTSRHKPNKLSSAVPFHVPSEAVQLMVQMVRLVPSQRTSLRVALLHPFFEALLHPTARLPNGRPLPDLCNFSFAELANIAEARQHIVKSLPVRKPEQTASGRRHARSLSASV
eukprot:m.182894 g.182894  ORF g.182894 m.182894 type:complete len:397 (-) comp53486_c0_seq8:165-1355(-)